MAELPRNEKYNKTRRVNKIWLTCASCNRAFVLKAPAHEGEAVPLADCPHCGFENIATITIRVKK